MVLLDDADLDYALPNTAQVCFHAGQGCAVNTRLLVPAHLHDVDSWSGLPSCSDCSPAEGSGPVWTRCSVR